MTIQELNQVLTEQLQYYIRKNEHINTGKLLRSVKYVCTYINFNLDIRLQSEEYIQYLDEGTFLDSFYSLFKVQEAFADFFITNIVANFDKLKF